jgi:hypothetical protein
VAKPSKHRGKWRLRWVDEQHRRQSAVFDDYRRAQTELSRRQVEAEEIKRGIRNAAPPEKIGDDLFDYWIDKRAPAQAEPKGRREHHPQALRPAFGTMRLRVRAPFRARGARGSRPPEARRRGRCGDRAARRSRRDGHLLEAPARSPRPPRRRGSRGQRGREASRARRTCPTRRGESSSRA